jgi:hypothetical protein
MPDRKARFGYEVSYPKAAVDTAKKDTGKGATPELGLKLRLDMFGKPDHPSRSGARDARGNQVRYREMSVRWGLIRRLLCMNLHT